MKQVINKRFEKVTVHSELVGGQIGVSAPNRGVGIAKTCGRFTTFVRVPVLQSHKLYVQTYNLISGVK